VGAEKLGHVADQGVCTTRSERSDVGESSEVCDRNCAFAAQRITAVGERLILGARSA
jgi:hypothetical protein